MIEINIFVNKSSVDIDSIALNLANTLTSEVSMRWSVYVGFFSRVLL